MGKFKYRIAEPWMRKKKQAQIKNEDRQRQADKKLEKEVQAMFGLWPRFRNGF